MITDEKGLQGSGPIVDIHQSELLEITKYLEAVERLTQGEFDLKSLDLKVGELKTLGEALNDLARRLFQEKYRNSLLEKIIQQAEAGISLEDLLESIYEDFRDLIPYNRIEVAFLEDEGKIVRCHWVKTDQKEVYLPAGHQANLEDSGLQEIIKTREPRIINDLSEHLKQKPFSVSTAKIVSEGMRSSLACPLIVDDRIVGFIFFTSVLLNTYTDDQAGICQQISARLSPIIERGHLNTQLVAQNKVIENQNEELSRLNELKNNILGIAAHDLRSPIGFIQTTTDLLLSDEADLYKDYRKDLLQSVRRQTNYLLDLLNDLLDYVAIQGGKMSITSGSFDMAELLKGVIESQSQSAMLKGTRLTSRIDGSGPVIADRLRLRQAIENLISNAIKYSPPGSQVQVNVERKEKGWNVAVIDQGPGIAESDRERLFQPFSRLTAKPTAGEKSTGLGLAITSWIVEAHGGSIGEKSEPGKGATFWFFIPDQEIMD